MPSRLLDGEQLQIRLKRGSCAARVKEGRRKVQDDHAPVLHQHTTNRILFRSLRHLHWRKVLPTDTVLYTILEPSPSQEIRNGPGLHRS